MYIQLYTKSVYSLLNSSLTIDEYVARGKQYGMPALALTDEGNVYGLIQFYQACLKAGIKPILGLTLTFQHYTLVFIAKNNKGYRNLLKLATINQLSEAPHLTIDSIKSYMDDLYIVLPTKHSPLESLLASKQFSFIGDLLNELKTISDDIYLGYHPFQTLLQQAVQYISSEYKVPMVFLNEVNALDEDDRMTLDYLRAIRDGNKIMTKPFYDEPKEFTFLSPQLIDQTMFQEAMKMSLSIMESCQVTLELGGIHLPKFPTPQGIDSNQYLKLLCRKGLEKRLNTTQIPSHYMNRLIYELKVIEEMNFSDYFLIVYDFVKYAKQNHIYVGPGRGSAAGSLVSYVLGITNVDPIEYNLLFERFLNPERISMPDIDLDFEDIKRDEVIKYVQNKYGNYHVAHIIAFGTFATRSAIREVAKVMDIHSTRLNEILSLVSSQQTIRQSMETNKELQSLMKEFPDINHLFQIALKIEGIPRNTTTHAAGIIISKEPLTDLTALQPGLNGVYQTQYEAKDLETLGLIKMDFLGLKNLTTIHQIVDLVKQTRGQDIQLTQLQLNDRKTFQLIARGDTTGIFQLESAGMRRVLRQMKASEFEDIVAANALYRPGPMDNIGTFIKRKLGQEPIDYLHPSLEPILKPTYGIIVYQEQIMQIAQKVANYTLGRADLLRRAISKKEKTLLEQERMHFINGAIQNGYTNEVATALFDYIVKFADYGFNRSHSVAYSVVSYTLAYLKSHYTPEFMTVLLSSVIGGVDQTFLYVKEARRYGLSILPVSINKSNNIYVIENNKNIRMPFATLKGMGKTTTEALLTERKNNGLFTSYFDFVKRTRSFLKQNVLNALIYAGALDEFQISKKAMIEQYEQMIDFLRFNPSGYFDDQLKVAFTEEEFPIAELMKKEKDILGFYLTTHPIRNLLKEQPNRNFIIPNEAYLHENKRVQLIGFVESTREILTKRQEAMMFLTLSDDLQSIPAVIFPNAYIRLKDKIMDNQLYLFKGRINRNKEKRQLVIEDCEIIEN